MFFKPTDIEIGALKVNNLDHGGAISFGATQKIGRNVCAKKTQGFGQQMADYTIQAVNVRYVLDDDSLDQFSIKINK
ncbi:MAG: hypothetical protein Q8934_03470 [Bacillota bacterium]|nr:hypothetical protein [Bacillota bacterium]